MIKSYVNNKIENIYKIENNKCNDITFKITNRSNAKNNK